MMRIKQLELENFRGAQNLKLELHDRLNLFVGLNGAGKSTVLDAAAILLSWLANRIKSGSAPGRPIDNAEFKNLRVRRDPLRMEVEKHGEPLAVGQLSDGEKCLMAMVGDMARRMAIANPMHHDPLEGEGVFLIDEIDLHLHPAWQRMVIPGLIKVFPNCQFLISTHSPHVITHVEPKSLFMFTMTKEGLQCSPASESYGKTVERVLEDLMGLPTTRPNEVQLEIDGIYAMIDAGQLEKARTGITELKEKIGSDPELVRAEVLIRRKELIGK